MLKTRILTAVILLAVLLPVIFCTACTFNLFNALVVWHTDARGLGVGAFIEAHAEEVYQLCSASGFDVMPACALAMAA